MLAPSCICAEQIALAWDPNQEADVAGYIVYYGTRSGTYRYDVDVGNHTGCTISGLRKYRTYYFAVTAYNAQGDESDFSDEISFRFSSSMTSSSSSTAPAAPTSAWSFTDLWRGVFD